MVALKWMQRKDRQSKRDDRKTGFRHWKVLAASALVAGAALIFKGYEREVPPQQNRAVPAQKGAASHEGQISFQDACKNPALRSRYLEELNRSWQDRCVDIIIYDPDGKKYAGFITEYYRMVAKLGLVPQSDRIKLSDFNSNFCRYANALVPEKRLTIGKGDKQGIFVCSKLFDKGDEEHFRSTIMVHERTHACDNKFGLRDGNKIVDPETVGKIREEVWEMIIESRAWGNELKAIPPQLWIQKDFLFEQAIDRFMTFYSFLAEIESILSGIKLNIEKSPFDWHRSLKERSKEATEVPGLQLIRSVLLEYTDTYFELALRLDALEVRRKEIVRESKLQEPGDSSLGTIVP
jgi:hypothetical protein